MLLFRSFEAVFFGEAGGDLVIGAHLLDFAFALVAAELDGRAADVERLVGLECLVGDRAMDLLELAGHHHLLAGLGGEFSFVFLKCLGAIAATEIDLASFKLHGLVGLAGFAGDRALGVLWLGVFRE